MTRVIPALLISALAGIVIGCGGDDGSPDSQGSAAETPVACPESAWLGTPDSPGAGADYSVLGAITCDEVRAFIRNDFFPTGTKTGDGAITAGYVCAQTRTGPSGSTPDTVCADIQSRLACPEMAPPPPKGTGAVTKQSFAVSAELVQCDDQETAALVRELLESPAETGRGVILAEGGWVCIQVAGSGPRRAPVEHTCANGESQMSFSVG